MDHSHYKLHPAKHLLCIVPHLFILQCDPALIMWITGFFMLPLKRTFQSNNSTYKHNTTKYTCNDIKKDDSFHNIRWVLLPFKISKAITHMINDKQICHTIQRLQKIG